MVLIPTRVLASIASVILGVAACAACQSTGGADLGAPLCEGEADPQLVVSLTPALQEGLSSFTHPWGTRFLRIAGDCSYVVSGSAWGSAREGTLDGELRERVESDLHYRELPGLQGTWRTAGCYDPPTLEFTNGSHVVRCVCECKDPGTPDDVQDAVAHVEGTLRALTDAGSEWSGPLRILVVRNRAIDDEVATSATWPLATPLSEIAVESSELYDEGQLRAEALEGTLFAEGADLAALRAMIRDYAERFAPPTGALPVRDTDGSGYELYGRDELDL